MGGNNLIKKGLVLAVILLFIGLAFAPSINANVSKASVDSELVEFTTEVCGINGVTPNTVSLSKEDAEEVELLIDDIERRLDNVETREETVDIFNKAVVELDKYGLLGGLSVKQAQKLVTGKFLDTKIAKIFGRLANGNNFSEWENRNCLVYGRIYIDFAIFMGAHLWIPWLFLMEHPKLMEIFQDFFWEGDYDIPLRTLLLYALIAGSLLFASMYNPFQIFTCIWLGWFLGYCEGPLFIDGVNGKQNFSEDYYGLITGFTGIRLYIPWGSSAFIGVAYYSRILQWDE